MAAVIIAAIFAILCIWGLKLFEGLILLAYPSLKSIESIEEGARSRETKGQTSPRELDTDRFGFIRDGGPSDWHVNREGPTLTPAEIEKRRVKEEERLAKWGKPQISCFISYGV